MADKYKTPSEQELQSATEIVRLILVDVDKNCNKWWNGYVLKNGDFYCEYGRVQDAKGDCRHDYYERKDLKGKSASDHLATKVKEKNRKGYVEQRVTAAVGAPAARTSSTGKAIANHDLKAVATREIKGDNETRKLVGWLAEVNIHNITQSTNISYDVATGSFTTPLGTLVTPDGLVEARDLLTSLQPYVQDREWEDAAYKRLLGQYLQIIPQDVGRGRDWHTTVLAGGTAIREQNDIIDALETALTTSAKTVDGKKAKDAPAGSATFNVTLDVVSDNKIISGIKKKYREEKGSHYDVRDYDVRRAWTVNITTVREAFQAQGVPIGNVKQLWHGTRCSHLLSILKGGLVIPRSSAPHVCGRLFGDGVYFSDQSTKSIRYATGAWQGSGNTERVFMFIADVALGKSYKPRGYQHGSFRIPAGYNSCFAEGGVSGVQNNEFIVYNTYQCDLTYLVEFSK